MLVSLQALRALAAWLVVFHHFMQVFYDFQADSLGGHLLSTRGQVGVDIFFVLSGFVIYLSTAGRQISRSTFLLHRLARIAPAYWLYTAVTAAILYFANDVMPIYGLAARELWLSLFFIPSENPAGFGPYPILPVGWTLNFEMLFYLLFALSFGVSERWRVGMVSVLVLVVSLVVAREPFISNFYRNPIIFEFLLGVGLAVLYRRGVLQAPKSLAVIAALSALSCLAAFPADHPWRLLTWGLPSALLVGACVILEPWFAGSRLCKALGDWSYSVYLVHIIVLWLGDYWLHQQWGLTPYETLAICLPTILLLSWGSYEWVERRLSRTLRQGGERLLGLRPRLATAAQ